MRRKSVHIFRNSFPGLELPFYPRGTGINYFELGEIDEYLPRPFCEICWVTEGMCRCDYGEEPVLLKEGECFFWYSGESHRKQMLGTEQTVVYYATFDGPGASDFLRSFGYSRKKRLASAFPKMLFTRLARGLASHRREAYLALLPIYTELLVRMGEDSRDKTPIDPFSDECLYLIQTRCDDCEFNVNELSERLGVHRSTICRSIFKATGQSPIEYIESCRMERAFELLRTTNLPVKIIAERTGFRRSNYFCRLFRKVSGLTPQEWRKRGMC